MTKKGIFILSVELLYCFMTESLSVWNGRYNKSPPLEPWWLIIPSVSTNTSLPQASPPRKWRNACEGDRGAVSFLCNPLWSHFRTTSRESWMRIVRIVSTRYRSWSRKAAKHWNALKNGLLPLGVTARVAKLQVTRRKPLESRLASHPRNSNYPWYPFS